MSAAAALADLAERYWQFLKEEQSFGAFIAGQLESEIILFREAPADYDRRLVIVEAFAAELSTIPIDGLNAQDRATHGLLLRELTDIRAFYDVDAHLRPALLPVGPDFNTVFYANATSVTDATSARLHADRLEQLPAFLADIRACLAAGHAKGIRYPRIVLEASAAATRGIAAAAAEDSPWYAPYRRSSVAAHPVVAAQAARALAYIGETLIPSLLAYAEYVAGTLAEGARETLSATDSPGGERYYALLAQHFTTVELDPAQIHELGLAEVARVELEIERVAADAGFAGDVAGYRRFLLTDPQFVAPDADTLRMQLEVLCKRVDAKIPAFFRRIPRITYGVETIPAAASASLPSAYALPASPGGTAAGMIYVNGLPGKCPAYLHPALVVHEAWPGHLMHIGLMAELDHLPAFRRYGASKHTACVEGWALYCEQLGLELGVYQTAHHHYGRYEMEMWRACRLVVDTGIHLHGWSREQSIDYMATRLTLGRDTIAAEVDRYAALPGQALAYQIGGLKFRELRARAENALGDDFDLRAFHEAVMTVGGVTLPVLEDVVDAWIAEQRSVALAA